MKIKRNFKKIIILSIVIILSFMGIYTIYTHRVYTELDYCKELGRNLGWLNMKQYNCVYIENGDDEQTIRIGFNLKSYDNYSNSDEYNQAINDISMVKRTISEYLKEYPENELNFKKIICIFNNLPGEHCYMYNYDFRLEDDFQELNDFLYFDCLYADLLLAESFKGSRVIDLRVKDLNDISLLEEWNNLEELKLSGIEFSAEDKQYLINLLPNCTIICNGETLRKISDNGT